MLLNEFTFSLLYFISLGISLGILVYTWKHRNAPGTYTYLFYVIGQSLWIGGFIFEMLAPSLAGKIFWDKFQWVASFFIIISFPVFTVQFTKVPVRYSRQLTALSFAAPVIFLTLLLTDRYHHLIYPNPLLIQDYIFPELRYDFTWIVYAFSFYSYLVIFAGMGILFRQMFKSHSLYRLQILTMLIGFVFPVCFTMLTLAGLEFKPFRDVSPFTFAIGNIVVALGLFRFRTFEVTPVARDHIFEAMIDPVVVLDNRSNIIDINRSMLDLLGKEAEQTVGKPARVVFDNFPIPIRLYAQASYARVEASFDVQGTTVYYEMVVWPLFNDKREMIGRIYISHDITALKELERELRELNRDLEKRVEERTHDLAEAYDTTLVGWAKALELRDRETEGHSRRVTETTLSVARALRVPEDELIHIRRGTILHDIGKMGVPDDILHKPGPLDPEERSIMQQHPEYALKMLENVPFLKKALDIPYCHHEQWDGSGYPRGLKGEEIPLAARIFSIVDVWDALLSDRPYSKPWTKEKAVEYLKSQAGLYFDPKIVEVFLRLVNQGQV